MKKLIALLLIVVSFTLCFTACGEPDNTTIRVGYLTGPTGMGMAKLIHDVSIEDGAARYSFERYPSPTEAAAALAAGKVDLICIDTNGAADYFNKYSNAKVLCINTLSSLFLVTDKNTTVTSFSELDGKTIYTCKAGTPKIITEFLVSKAGINTTVSNVYNGKVIASPQELGALLTEGSIDIAVVPEPILTSSLMTIKSNQNTDIEYSIDIPLASVWEEYSDTDAPMAMGCLIGNADFVKEHKGIVNAFLHKYKSSIEFVNNKENVSVSAEYVAEAKIMGAAKPSEVALKNLNGAIAYVDGKEMKDALIAFYSALNVTLPSEDFYYED